MAQDSLKKIVAFLERLATNRSLAESLVESGFRAVTPDAIRMWVREKVKLLPDEVRKLYFENPEIAPYTRRALIQNWALVERYLAKPDNTLKKIASISPENEELLEDPQTRSYVIEELTGTYKYLVEFAFGAGR